MHDEPTEVQQHPAALRRALAVAEVVALLPEFLFQVLVKRAKLQRRLRRRDHEIVGEGSVARDVEQRDIQRLVVCQDIDCTLRQRLGIQ